MRGICRLGMGLLVCVFAWPAQAWGPLGHAIVADLAQRHLTASAQAEIRRLLAPEHVHMLAAVASWADDIQDDPAHSALWLKTRRQHYVDFRGRKCHFEPPTDCRRGQCVIAGIEHYVGVLADRSRDDAVRREALKFVVHFIGDVHQPLHAGYRDDKGGNTWQVEFDGRGSNLHRVWDSGLLKQRKLAAVPYARMLDSQATPRARGRVGATDTAYVQWAEESCRITAEPGFYPLAHKISRAYVDGEVPVAEQRLRAAGYRLASVLNEALSVNPRPNGIHERIDANSSARLER